MLAPEKLTGYKYTCGICGKTEILFEEKNMPDTWSYVGMHDSVVIREIICCPQCSTRFDYIFTRPSDDEVRDLIKNRGITIRDLANKSCVFPSTITRFMNGTTEISAETKYRLYSVLTLKEETKC